MPGSQGGGLAENLSLFSFSGSGEMHDCPHVGAQTRVILVEAYQNSFVLSVSGKVVHLTRVRGTALLAVRKLLAVNVKKA